MLRKYVWLIALLLIGVAGCASNAKTGPLPSPLPTADQRLSAGTLHTCQRTTNGETLCWGVNGNGELGIGSSNLDQTSSPITVTGNIHFKAISAGDFTCAIDLDGKAYCWGNRWGDKPTLVTDEPRFKSVSVGSIHACGIALDETAFCWGDNDFGLLGDGTDAPSDIPVQVTGNLRFSAIAASKEHTCALTTAGEAYCWGGNSAEVIGNSTSDGSFVPLPVTTNQRFVSLSSRNAHTCALTSIGEAYCWGYQLSGELGIDPAINSANRPIQVTGNHKFRSIGAGTFFTCGLDITGKAYCWGNSGDGKLGNTSYNTHRPTPVDGGHTFTELSVGSSHACGIATNGTVYCWGNGITGQLGAGDRFKSARTPIPVTAPITN